VTDISLIVLLLGMINYMKGGCIFFFHEIYFNSSNIVNASHTYTLMQQRFAYFSLLTTSALILSMQDCYMFEAASSVRLSQFEHDHCNVRQNVETS
jgi:hypothetical protein